MSGLKLTVRRLALAAPAFALVIAFVMAAALSQRADARTARAQAGPALTTAAFRGKDRFCDPWNFDRDPDCRAARFRTQPVPEYGATDATGATGATDATGSTGPTADPWQMPGDWVWPAPPRGAYATLHPKGRFAIAPKSAPRAVKRMIRAANSLTRKPYVWGGGHAGWKSRGYDCSGATSFVLRAGGFASWPMVSGTLARWGVNGPGRWVRVYAHKDHVFLVIAGLRFDTSPWGAGTERGPRWRATVRTTRGFALRHPLRY